MAGGSKGCRGNLTRKRRPPRASGVVISASFLLWGRRHREYLLQFHPGASGKAATGWGGRHCCASRPCMGNATDGVTETAEIY